MNCDHVFTILTRGPFPTGDMSDRFVESHLLHCESCRELAEALRPTPDFGPESVSDEESWELPVYWSQHSDAFPGAPVSGMVATAQAAVKRMVRRGRPRRPIYDRVGLRLAGAVILGVLFGFVWQRMDDQLHETPGGSWGGTSDETRFNRQAKRGSVDLDLLKRIGLAEACYSVIPTSARQQESLAKSPLKDVRYAAVKCCADCHHPDGTARQTAATVAVIHRCAVCHVESR